MIYSLLGSDFDNKHKLGRITKCIEIYGTSFKKSSFVAPYFVNAQYIIQNIF